jgi:hypothetical protein
MGKHIYLRDDEHLHDVSQVKRICNGILQDYKSGKISYKTAMSRLVEMENLIIPRTEALKDKSLAESYVQMAKLKLMRMHQR